MIAFLNIIAWVFGIGCTIWTILKCVGYWHTTCTEAGQQQFRMERLAAMVKGHDIKPVLNIKWCGLTAIICWCWVIAQYTGS